jgi:hypothetical protein
VLHKEQVEALEGLDGHDSEGDDDLTKEMQKVAKQVAGGESHKHARLAAKAAGEALRSARPLLRLRALRPQQRAPRQRSPNQ